MDEKRVKFNSRGSFNIKKYGLNKNKFNLFKGEGKHNLIGIFTLTIFFAILFTSFVSSSFSLGNPNYSITKAYGPEYNVTGWINISFNNEPLDSLFTDSFDNSAALSQVLNKSPSYAYACVPSGCGKDYAAIGTGSDFVKRNLAANQETIYGMRILGNNFNAVTVFSFDFSSDAGSSETPQLKIDVLNDGKLEWVPYAASGSFNEIKKYGCYTSPATDSGVVTLTQLNNLVKLPPSPNVKIGAFVTRIPSASGNANFTLEIKEISTGRTGSCNVNNIAFQSGDIECIPAIGAKNFTITNEGNFYIAVWARQGSEGKYIINYKINESCRGSAAESFQLFAKSGTYAALGNYRINNTEIERSTSIPTNIENDITNYITRRYGTNCTNGCTIPIKFSSNTSQTLDISNIQVFYQAGVPKFAAQIYELNESSPKITSGFQRLYLDRVGFTVPDDFGNHTFSLELNNIDILSEKIEIKNVPIINSINPSSTASAYPTEFSVSVSLPKGVSITSYQWNFGDNSTPITTAINKSVHIYPATGTYPLTISVKDSRGFSSSKTFDINVTSPKELINATLKEMNKSLQKVNSDIQRFQNPFYITALNNVLKLQDTKSVIGNLTTRYNNPANNESDYNEILTDLLKVRVPESIFKTEEGKNFVFLTDKDFVDMDIVSQISGETYSASKEKDYENAVAAWQANNVNVTVSFIEFSGEFNSETERITKIFEIKTSLKNTSVNYDYYLIMPELQGMDFDRNVNRSQGFVYVNLKSNPNLAFYTTEDIGFSELSMFVAPAISKLNLEDIGIMQPDKSKTLILILIIAVLLVAAVIVYFILQKWYKKKYEKYLFPNRNDLYNLAIYVNNAKKKGLSNSDIKEHLKKAGWNSEQIRYIMRKYEGKNTGMLEFPVTKIAEKTAKDEHKSHGHIPRY